MIGTEEPNEEVAPAKPNGEIPVDEISGALPELATHLTADHASLYLPAYQACVAANENFTAAQERLNAAILGQRAAAGALTYVVDFLRPKYQMGPTDDIDSEGNILRKGA